MKIELNPNQYVWTKKKNRGILDIQVSIDTEKLPPSTIKRIKNALQKGYYGSGADSVIGTGIKELVKKYQAPYIFCNRAYWTCGLTFYNISEEEIKRIKEYIKSMSNIADIKMEREQDWGIKDDNATRWRVSVEDSDKNRRANALARKDFVNILKASLQYYNKEIITKENKEKLINITKEF